MKRKMRVISPLVALVMLALVLPGTTVAHISESCRFYGPVTVNGQDVPDGTVVTAWLESPSAGPWTTTTYTRYGASWYVIDIPADDLSTPDKEGGVAGDQVHFSLNDGSSIPVPGTATWERVGRVYHSLSISHAGITGDVNGDGHVNVLDLILVGQRLGDTGPPGWIPEDINEDGHIDVLDMILIGQHWTG